MKKWLKRRRQKRIDKSFRVGYDWAAGELLRGNELYVDSQLYWCNPCSDSSETSRAFDSGASAAVRDYSRLSNRPEF